MKELSWKISEWASSTVQRSLPSTYHRYDLEEGRHSPDMYGGPHGGHPQGQPTSYLVCRRWSRGRDWRWWPPYPFPWHRSQTPLPSTWSISRDLRIRGHGWGAPGKGACVRNLNSERASSPPAGSRSPLYHRHGVLQDHSCGIFETLLPSRWSSRCPPCTVEDTVSCCTCSPDTPASCSCCRAAENQLCLHGKQLHCLNNRTVFCVGIKFSH